MKTIIIDNDIFIDVRVKNTRGANSSRRRYSTCRADFIIIPQPPLARAYIHTPQKSQSPSATATVDDGTRRTDLSQKVGRQYFLIIADPYFSAAAADAYQFVHVLALYFPRAAFGPYENSRSRGCAPTSPAPVARQPVAAIARTWPAVRNLPAHRFTTPATHVFTIRYYFRKKINKSPVSPGRTVAVQNPLVRFLGVIRLRFEFGTHLNTRRRALARSFWSVRGTTKEASRII